MGAVMHLVQHLGEEVVEGHCAVLAGGGRVGVVRNAEEMLALLDAWGIRGGARDVLKKRVTSVQKTGQIIPC
jgi:hypothetical protein